MTELLTEAEWAEIGRTCAATRLVFDVGRDDVATYVLVSLTDLANLRAACGHPCVVARTFDSPDLPGEPHRSGLGELMSEKPFPFRIWVDA